MSKIWHLLLITCIMLAIAGMVVPWALYIRGIANIEGRPMLASEPISDKKAQLLWYTFGGDGQIQIENVNPLTYIFDTIHEKNLPGLRLATFIAMQYTQNHSKNREPVWIYVSERALAIWLIRNANTEQMMSTAYSLLPPREKSKFMNE